MLWREVKWVGTTDMFNVGVSQAEYLGGGGRLVCARVGGKEVVDCGRFAKEIAK